MNSENSSAEGVWCLRGLGEDDESRKEVTVAPLPFRIGRRKDNSLCLPSPSVSKVHCELQSRGDALTARDLGSTNGTYVNGERISSESQIHRGDVVQFGDCGFRLDVCDLDERGTTCFGSSGATRVLPARAFLVDVLRGRRLAPHFQPIVSLAQEGAPIGYELLIRSDIDGLRTPAELFSMAKRLSLEVRLSEICRLEGGKVGGGFGGAPLIFMNTHPAEMGTDGLIQSLRELRDVAPDMRIVVEVHEEAAADVPVVRRLRDVLEELDMQLAYDDFGAGLARIHELVEVIPDVLKFDRLLVKDLHLAPARRQNMVASLVAMVRDLGVEPLAEGIECCEEADVCRDMGFTQAQGYYFGRPFRLDAAATST